MCRRLIGARNRTEADRQPIPTVNRDDGQRQVHEFLLSEMLMSTRVDFFGDVLLAHLSYRFRPSQRGAFSFRKEWRFASGNDRVEALL